LNAKKNLLLDEEVVVTSIFADSVLQASPWKSPFKINNFISKLFYQVLQNKLNLYNPIFEDSVFHPLDKESWLSILRNNKHLTFDTTQFNDIYFYETWELDTLATIQFNKNVIFWAPIKTDKELKQRKLAGKVKCHASDANTLLAKHVIYEFPFEDSITPNFSLNKNKLVRLLIDKAIKKPSDAYHPFTAKPLTKDELYQRLEISDSSLFSPYHNISSIVFIENWYYNPENFSIRKEVLGLAPVKIIFNGDEPSKSIPFVFFFNETPFVLM
ncbi:MAG: hypothetical protein HPY79_09415, partial [Bacteroidales bacterium]|nr:hypothetical protein [Bacteroidales bacterium]